MNNFKKNFKQKKDSAFNFLPPMAAMGMARKGFGSLINRFRGPKTGGGGHPAENRGRLGALGNLMNKMRDGSWRQ